MNEELNQGGLAFPVSLPGWGDNGACGMTLRDYFAGQTLVAAMTGANNLGTMSALERRELLDKVSQICYEVSDAMIRAKG